MSQSVVAAPGMGVSPSCLESFIHSKGDCRGSFYPTLRLQNVKLAVTPPTIKELSRSDGAAVP
jgi:hypothetical protein